MTKYTKRIAHSFATLGALGLLSSACVDSSSEAIDDSVEFSEKTPNVSQPALDRPVLVVAHDNGVSTYPIEALSADTTPEILHTSGTPMVLARRGVELVVASNNEGQPDTIERHPSHFEVPANRPMGRDVTSETVALQQEVGQATDLTSNSAGTLFLSTSSPFFGSVSIWPGALSDGYTAHSSFGALAVVAQQDEVMYVATHQGLQRYLFEGSPANNLSAEERPFFNWGNGFIDVQMHDGVLYALEPCINDSGESPCVTAGHINIWLTPTGQGVDAPPDRTIGLPGGGGIACALSVADEGLAVSTCAEAAYASPAMLWVIRKSDPMWWNDDIDSWLELPADGLDLEMVWRPATQPGSTPLATAFVRGPQQIMRIDQAEDRTLQLTLELTRGLSNTHDMLLAR